MKPDNWNRFAAGLLAILLCLCSFSMPAFASGSDPAPEQRRDDSRSGLHRTFHRQPSALQRA